jgi:hypothetical protein
MRGCVTIGKNIIMHGLCVPFAIDDRLKLYSPTTAEKSKNYFCPSCGEPVIFKQGKIRIAHFAHKISDSCNQETITHKTAKLLVQGVVQDWKSGKSSPPTLARACQICHSTINQPLPEKVDKAILEYKLSDGFIIDVALMVGDVAQAAVEINVTHAVDNIKAGSLSVPFIELDGYEVIANPTIWKPITDGFKPFACEKCKQTYTRFIAKIKRIAKATGIELPNNYYRYGLYNCWKCRKEIIVFVWSQEERHDNTIQTPKVKPLPKTVQYRRRYEFWVNTCPYCHSIQEGHYLTCEPDSPFMGINCLEDSPLAFKQDMMAIAAHAKYNEKL